MMGTKNLLTLKAQFDFDTKLFLNEFVYGNMTSVMGSVWVSICNFVFYVFRLMIRIIFRSQANDSKNDYGGCVIPFQPEDQAGSRDSDIDGFREERESFRSATASSVSKYEFLSGKGIGGFLEGPKAVSFSVQELYTGSNDYTVCNDQILLANRDCGTLNSEEEAVDQLKTEDSVESFGIGKALEKPEQNTYSKYEFMSGKGFGGFLEGANDYTVCNDRILRTGIFLDKDCETFNSEEEAFGQLKTEESVLEKAEQNTFTEDGISETGEIDGSEANCLGKNDSVDEAESVSEDCSLRFCSGPESICSNGELSDSDHIIDSIIHEFLADKKVGEELESEALLAIDGEEVQDIQEIPSCENVEQLSDCESLSGPEETVARNQSHDSDDEYIELEPHLQNLSSFKAKALSGKVENKHEEESEAEISLEESEGTDLRNEPSESSSDYQDELDLLWEHRDIIEQLKMELRNARAGGLPTILEEEEEEPESPTIVQGLKPLKIAEKFEFKDRMEEVQKVYKSYAEKMRKLDMLNSQTMHAIGFLQLKDPVKSISMQNKPSASAGKSVPHNIWPRKARRVMAADPMQKFSGELRRDLELVYVGQICLSWEILHWQYVKAQELQEYDSQGFHWYNQVADEFQLFQVLVQRFVENEAFQGPRVQNYVNNRCVLRNLLQVPAIRDDCLKDKKVIRRDEEEDAISSCMIAKIIEESMRVFWGFLRADHKDEGNVILNGPWQNHMITLQNDADLGFLMDLRADLQKKEKKLKEILRSGNCIVKRFQKQQNDKILDHLLLFAQVELKLVSRVLNMSRLTTDQLVWCREKLGQINFIQRRIHVDPTFLLFPC